MKSVAILALASGLFTLTSAQVYPVITADDVANSTREIWCDAQKASCQNLCQDQTHADAEHNDCWTEDLYFECICKGGAKPNQTEYSLPIPYNLCQESKQACANNCGNNQDCATQCFEGKQCGATDPRRVTLTSSSTTSTPTASSSDSPADSTSTDDAKATDDPFADGMGVSLVAFGSAYGVGAMIAGMAIGFFGML